MEGSAKMNEIVPSKQRVAVSRCPISRDRAWRKMAWKIEEAIDIYNNSAHHRTFMRAEMTLNQIDKIIKAAFAVIPPEE